MPTCIYCKSSVYKSLFFVRDIFLDNYELLKCSNCKIDYLFPYPTVAQLAKAYDDSYYGEGEKKFNPIIDKIVNSLRRIEMRFFTKYLGNTGNVLDIGCGDGSLLHRISETGNFLLTGIELPGRAAERAKLNQSLDLIEGRIETVNFSENTFDFVSIIHVFEHLDNPKEVIEIIRKIVKLDGHLLIEFPNINSWQSRIFKANWFHLDPPRHLNFFPPETLEAILLENGFMLKKKRTFSVQFNPYGVQQSFLNLVCGKRDVLYEFLKGNKAYCEGYKRWKIYLQVLFLVFTLPFLIITDFIANLFYAGGTYKAIFQLKS